MAIIADQLSIVIWTVYRSVECVTMCSYKYYNNNNNKK